MCGGRVDERTGYRRTEGWARHRVGANQLVLRRTLDVWACQHCIDRARSGLPPGQEQLTA
jgi:hypothetical protein